MTFDPTSPDLHPVHLAYLAAAVLLPVRLLIILRASREVPRLHARTQEQLASGEEVPNHSLRRSSNPYADLATALGGLARSGRAVAEFDSAFERTLTKASRRALRSQALDAAGLLLLVGLLLTDTASSPLGPGSVGVAGFLGLVLALTMVARARLSRQLDLVLRDLAARLRQRLELRTPDSACAFCGSSSESAAIEVTVDGARQRVIGTFCRNCGKAVATLPIPP